MPPFSFDSRLFRQLFTTGSIWITNPLAGIKRLDHACARISNGRWPRDHSWRHAGLLRGLWPYFPLRRRVGLGNRVAFCPKRVLSKSTFSRKTGVAYSSWGRWSLTLCRLLGGREAMFAGGKALADCLRRRFFRPSATWQGTLPSPQLPPLLRSSLRPPTLHTPCPATRPALRQFWWLNITQDPPFPFPSTPTPCLETLAALKRGWRADLRSQSAGWNRLFWFISFSQLERKLTWHVWPLVNLASFILSLLRSFHFHSS